MKALGIMRAVCAVTLVVAASGALAQPEGETVKRLLGNIGIIPKSRSPIEYRERPPLVLPPKLDLRAPVDPGSVESRAANWPRDPDVAAAARAAEEARKPVTETELYRANRANSALSVEEMRAARRPGGGEITHVTPAMTGNTDRSIMSVEEMRAQDTRRTEKPVLAGAEPERRTLTEPPTGYRKPAAGAPLRASADPAEDDPDDPMTFTRQQAKRR